MQIFYYFAPMKIQRILMVCLGNICRSPMAEGIMRNVAHEEELEIEVDSAGTGGWHVGEPPDERAVRKMQQKGLDISMLRARQFHVSDFEKFDLIFAMDVHNYNDIIRMARNAEEKNKVQMILNKRKPGSNESVPDPYYGGMDGFEHVYQLLKEACYIIAGELK